MLKMTNKLHPSKKMLGYYYIKKNDFFIAYCGNIQLHKYSNEKDCIKSFENRQ